MGFGTILGMHNLRAFLKQLADNVSVRKELKVETIEHRSNKRLSANGFSPGLDQLVILKGNEVIFEIDASDDDGFSCSGKKDHEAFERLRKAVDQGSLDAALSALDELVAAIN